MSRIGKTWLVWIVGIALVACTDPTHPATAVQLAFAVQPSNATAGVLINPVIAVAIQDASGNLVTNATNVVTLTIGSAASGGSLAGTASVPGEWSRDLLESARRHGGHGLHAEGSEYRARRGDEY